MQIIDDKNYNIEYFKDGVGITLGKFDGLHIGHQQLINRLNELCKENNIKSAVYTFVEHPHNIFEHTENVELLTSNEQKEKILENLGVEFLIYGNFDDHFAKQTPEDFFIEFIEKYNVKLIAVGHNFRFGYRKSGDINKLKELGGKYNVKIETVAPVTYNNPSTGETITVNSTKIRELLLKSNIDLAEKLLGRKIG